MAANKIVLTESPPVSVAEDFPAENLLHPGVVLAILILLVNDHYLKHHFAGFWTGKISDIAGLIFFPIFIQALWESMQGLSGRFRGHSRKVLLRACIATALVFSLVQFWSPAVRAYCLCWGGFNWLLMAIAALGRGQSITDWAPAAHTPDLTDILTLPSVIIAYYFGTARENRF